MKIVQSHPWNISPAEAIAIQQQLRGEVVREDQFGSVRHVAGVDVGFEESGAITRAAVVVLGFPTLELVQHAIFRIPTRFPYVPGLLSFREVPAVIGALEKLTVIPDLLLCDGQGIAHPRRFGIASHLGLLSGIPSIGVAKTRLVGEPIEPPDQRGASVPLIHHGETIGAILRSRAGVKPLYISLGHCISLDTALDYVMACVTRYRLPETTRWAHRLASGPAVE